MVDAAMAMTEQAVERFTEAYLLSLGAEIQKDDHRWTVSLPAEAETELELEDAVLEIASNLEEVSDDAFAVAPESPFVERLIDEAAELNPTGTLALTGEQCEIQPPSWITAGPATITDQTFTPYYDRQALCVSFHIGIETVSEYQTEKLHAIAIDLTDREERPRLADTYLALTESSAQERASGELSIEKRPLEDALNSARRCVKNEIAPSVQEIREQASYAAETEFNEYRQLVRQQRDELNNQIDRIDERLAEAGEAMDAATTQSDRMAALRRRKQLHSEVDDLRSEVDALSARIEDGFEKKQEDIQNRHSLTVRIRPVTATVLSYERGDLIFTLATENASKVVSYSYAVGTGVTDSPACERCDQEITSVNPLALNGEQVVGSTCCVE